MWPELPVDGGRWWCCGKWGHGGVGGGGVFSTISLGSCLISTRDCSDNAGFRWEVKSSSSCNAGAGCELGTAGGTGGCGCWGNCVWGCSGDDGCCCCWGGGGGSGGGCCEGDGTCVIEEGGVATVGGGGIEHSVGTVWVSPRGLSEDGGAGSVAASWDANWGLHTKVSAGLGVLGGELELKSSCK